MAEGRNTVLDYDKMVFSKALQARDSVIRERAENIAAAIRRNEEIDRLEVYEIDDPEDAAHHGGFYTTDGHTRGMGYELAGKKKAIPVKLYKGTWRDAVRAAAIANRSWDTQGLPRSNKDKERAVLMYAESYAGLPKKSCPSNRVTAKEVGVSPAFVDTLDPFGRGLNGDTGDATNVAARRKKKVTKATKAADESTKSPAGGGGLAFDFAQYDAHMKWMVSGFTALGETFGIKEESDFVTTEEVLNQFVDYIVEARKRFGKKKAKEQSREQIAKVVEEFKEKADAKKGKMGKTRKGKKGKAEEVDEDGFPVSYSDPEDVDLEEIDEEDLVLQQDFEGR